MDNVNTALHFVQGAIEQQPAFNNLLTEMQVEPLWRLGRYDDLDQLLKKPELENNNSWSVQIARFMLHINGNFIISV